MIDQEHIDALTQAFDKYLSDVRLHLNEHGLPKSMAGPHKIEALPSALRSWFDEREQFESWRNLVREWGKVLDESDWVSNRGEAFFPSDTMALAAWCRRKGVYYMLLRGSDYNAHETVRTLLEDSKKYGSTDPVTYADLLRTVDYSWEKRAVFGTKMVTTQYCSMTYSCLKACLTLQISKSAT